jgi:hypothetical protein
VRRRYDHVVPQYRRRQTLERYRALDRERVALAADQLRDHNLTRIIESDRGFKNGGAHRAVETEALSQRLIVQMVRDRLDAQKKSAGRLLALLSGARR